MDLGRKTIGVGLLAATLAFGLLPAVSGCAGKSQRSGEDGDEGGGSGGRGGTNGGGGTSGSIGKGGSGKGGSGKGGAANSAVMNLSQRGVDKADLLFMVDNSISMAHKQALLADAVPVLVQRMVDPSCVDSDGNPTGGTASSPCPGNSAPEFAPINDVHIAVISSSLGNHGGDVCVDAGEMPPRTLNDRAQLIASVRTGVYSYQNQGFLVWDPRMGSERPSPDPHPGLTEHETSASTLIEDFTTHVTAAGERGCGYEASLEAWYRFLIDPEPVADVTADMTTGYSLRGPVNTVVLTQRAQFLRPDSLLAIVMLTDENDCSISDENDAQGWLAGRRIPMPRGSSECSRPDDPNAYACCRPCVIDLPGCPPSAGDRECTTGASLSTVEDSVNLRCYGQKARFGIDLLYPWQRYVDALTEPRIRLRAPSPEGSTEVTNPIFTPGVDGTPARDRSLVFLAGIIGVPWQDLADDESLQSGTRGLRYRTAAELASSSPNRWDVVLGDPELGIPPTDPFMIESVEERPEGATNPVPGVAATVIASSGTGMNTINGHEQNVANRDDLQYACLFDLREPAPCGMANQDGCDCNASERDYNRPTCQYPDAGGDGIQVRAKAYPGVRHLQVLKGLGDNSIVASICPKNVQPQGSPLEDPNYGYNPAVAAIVERFKQALGPQCLPRPLTVDGNGEVACSVVEVTLPAANGCSCDTPGRADLPASGAVPSAIEDHLVASGYCEGATGVACEEYCLCEIQQFTGPGLGTCQSSRTDPGGLYGFCYVDETTAPDLVASCPATQPQIIRFLGNDLPAPRSLALVACTGR